MIQVMEEPWAWLENQNTEGWTRVSVMEKSFQVVGKYEQSHDGESVQTKLEGCPGS